MKKSPEIILRERIGLQLGELLLTNIERAIALEAKDSEIAQLRARVKELEKPEVGSPTDNEIGELRARVNELEKPEDGSSTSPHGVPAW